MNSKAHSKISLKTYNTFGIDVDAKKASIVYSEDQLSWVLSEFDGPFKVLGGGSNVLLTGDIDAHLIINRISGIEKISEDSESVEIEVGGGESWHDLVLWSIDQGYAGLENLSLIPGTVGAAPIQNIGAYGVEQESYFKSLRAIDLENGERYYFKKEECHFGYRDSIFKHGWKNRVVITKVTYELSKKPELVLTYGAVSSELEKRGKTNPTIKDVSDVIISIRQSKLPDPREIGNSGSFFKNPIISIDHYEKLKVSYEDIPSYPIDQENCKVPAGWLIDRAGWKGKRVGNTGTYKNQALVLVNHGDATGKEVYALALEIIESIKEKFGITLQPEVNIW